MSRTAFSQRNSQYEKLMCWYQTIFNSPSNPCAADWFPCYEETRHLACFSISSALSFVTKIRGLELRVPKVDLFQITQFNFQRGLLMAIWFFSCFCKEITLTWARIACVSSRGQTKSRVLKILARRLWLRVDHKEFSPP